MQSSATSRQYFSILATILSDIVSFYISITGAYFTRLIFDFIFPAITPLEFSYVHFLSLWWIPLLFVFFFGYEGLYTKRFLFWDEIKEILKTIGLSGLVLFSLVSLTKISDQISRVTLILLLLYMFLSAPFLRYITKILLTKIGVWEKRVLVLGHGDIADDTVAAIISEKNLGWGIPTFKSYPMDFSCMQDGDFDIVIFALHQADPKELKNAATEASRFAKIVYAVPDIKGVALPNADLYRIYTRQLLLLKLNNNLKSPVNKVAKWVLDRVLFLIALIPLAMIILFIATLIKIDSKGSVFYSHERIGKSGKRIRVYKFRSMYIDSAERLKKILSESKEAKKEWESSYKLKNDPRITRVGQYLRKYSLDELPQIFNVLVGNMSFVGPRPVLEKELTEYYKDDSRYYLNVHPGITGLWQVSGRNDTTYEMRVALDSWYVQNWSVWLDIVILFKTFKVVLSKDGAY